MGGRQGGGSGGRKEKGEREGIENDGGDILEARCRGVWDLGLGLVGRAAMGGSWGVLVGMDG